MKKMFIYLYLLSVLARGITIHHKCKNNERAACLSSTMALGNP